MNIWLITTGEIVPLNQERASRTGLLSKRLVLAGHQVSWWTTTFDHQNKTFLYRENTEVPGPDGVSMIYLHTGVGYQKNISLHRLRNHQQVSVQFRALAWEKPKPDLIFCSFPTIDLSYEAVKFGQEHHVPVIIDVRDLWPDIFFDPFPVNLQPVIKLALQNYVRKTAFALQQCHAITAVSEGYLNWALNYGKRQRTAADRVFPLGYERDASEMESTETATTETVTNETIATEMPTGPITEKIGWKTSECNNVDEQALFFSKNGLDPSKITVLFVGTFGQTYNLKTVIEATRALASENRRDIQFVFTGDGEKKAEWMALANGLGNIVFTGWVGKKELTTLLRLADIGLMAYSIGAPQGLPNKLFEYMSAGIPILSSLEGETKELLEKYSIGLTYQADKAESLLAQLRLLTDNVALRKKMGKNGLTLFEREFDSSIIYTKLVEYLENQVQ